jgi:L-ribulose-5-phosphate 3-epimerase
VIITLHFHCLINDNEMNSNITNPSRRKFIRNAIIAGGMMPVMSQNLFSGINNSNADRLKVYIFSKHLQFLDYKELADAAASMGFDGVDLSVRPNGHVLPERVEDDLPKAVEALKKAGLKPSLMTTAVNQANDPTDKKLLTTAAKLGFTHYRMNWYPYPENKPMPDSLEVLSQKVNALGELNKQLGLKGYYQNHAGILVGSVIWEIYELLKNADPNYMGIQYDIRHAMVEGATSWENGVKLIHERIQSISVKDYRWQLKDGKWTIEDVPIGEGMVDFRKYFSMLKQYKINVPVSLHIEYSLGGAEDGDRKISIPKEDVFKAMKKDLQKVQELWQVA